MVETGNPKAPADNLFQKFDLLSYHSLELLNVQDLNFLGFSSSSATWHRVIWTHTTNQLEFLYVDVLWTVLDHIYAFDQSTICFILERVISTKYSYLDSRLLIVASAYLNINQGNENSLIYIQMMDEVYPYYPSGFIYPSQVQYDPSYFIPQYMALQQELIQGAFYNHTTSLLSSPDSTSLLSLSLFDTSSSPPPFLFDMTSSINLPTSDIVRSSPSYAPSEDNAPFIHWREKFHLKIQLMHWKRENKSWNFIVDEFAKKGIRRKNTSCWYSYYNRTLKEVSILIFNLYKINLYLLRWIISKVRFKQILYTSTNV